MITELRTAVKKLIDVAVAAPAFAISASDASPSTCLRFTVVAPGGLRVCVPWTRSALELSAVLSIQKKGNRLTNSRRPGAPRPAPRPRGTPFERRTRLAAPAPPISAVTVWFGEMVVLDMLA